jgi:hypothetical protein
MRQTSDVIDVLTQSDQSHDVVVTVTGVSRRNPIMRFVDKNGATNRMIEEGTTVTVKTNLMKRLNLFVKRNKDAREAANREEGKSSDVVVTMMITMIAMSITVTSIDEVLDPVRVGDDVTTSAVTDVKIVMIIINAMIIIITAVIITGETMDQVLLLLSVPLVPNLL